MTSSLLLLADWSWIKYFISMGSFSPHQPCHMYLTITGEMTEAQRSCGQLFVDRDLSCVVTAR